MVENKIIEGREELMASGTGGISNRRIAHFLKSTVSSMDAPKLKLPSLSPKSRWPLEVLFHGWRDPQNRWVKWVQHMQSKYEELWKKAGIFDAIIFSKYRFHKNDELILGVAEWWCCDTNTFVFPWGEVTVTLEDVMILFGLPVSGGPVFLSMEGEELEEAEQGLKGLSDELRYHHEWLDFFMKSERKDEHVAFLSLWLSRFVFPGNESDKIGPHVFPIAVNLSRGIRIALAPAVLASVYKDLSLLKVAMNSSAELEAESDDPGSFLAVALWAPLQLVQLWVWERFLMFRPEPNYLESGDIRAARWHDGKRDDIGNVRPIINSSGDVFLWKPYCLAMDEWRVLKFYKEEEEWVEIGHFLEEELESFARCLRASVLVGIDCLETYQPHRVARQFGFDQDIPGMVPRFTGRMEIAWIDYDRPFCNDSRLFLPARLFESEMSVDYQKWWLETVLVPVSPFKGVAKRPRTPRIWGKNFSASRRAKVDCNALDASCTKVQIKVEPRNGHSEVPPGFLPKKTPHFTVTGSNYEAGNAAVTFRIRRKFELHNSDSTMTCGTWSAVELIRKGNDVAVVSQKQMKEGCNRSEDPTRFPFTVLRPGASPKLQIKEEC